MAQIIYKKIQNIFKDELFRSIMKFSIPVMIDQIFLNLIGTTNLAFCRSAGSVATSAVGLSQAIDALAQQIGLYVGTAGAIIVARYLGEKKEEEAKEAGRQGFFSGMIMSIFIWGLLWVFRYPVVKLLFGRADANVIQSIVDYMTIVIICYPLMFYSYQGFGILRATGDSRTPMNINIITAIVNITAGFVLISGFSIGGFKIGGYGAIGSAITLIVSRIAACILVTVSLKNPDFRLKVSFKLSYKPNWEIIKRIYSIALPAMLESLVFSGGRLISQAYATVLGTFSIAANSVANNMVGWVNIVTISYVTAAPPVVAEAIGRGDKKEVHRGHNAYLIINK